MFEMAAPIQSPAKCAVICHTISQHMLKWDILDLPPYSLDLAPSDFLLFLHLKKHLAGEKFDNDDEVQEEFMTWFKEQAADYYDSGIVKLFPRLNPLHTELNPMCHLLALLGAHHILHVSRIWVNKCLENAGDYVEI